MWRVGKDEAKPKALIIQFLDMEKKTTFLSKRKAFKGGKIYLSEDLTPDQVAHCKENMPQVLAARKEGKLAAFRDGRVLITEGRFTLWCMTYETLCMAVWNRNGSLRTVGGYFEDTLKVYGDPPMHW